MGKDRFFRYEVEVPGAWYKRILKHSQSNQAAFWASLPGCRVWDRTEGKFLVP